MKRLRRAIWIVLAVFSAIFVPAVFVIAQQMLIPGGNSSQPGIGFSNDSQQDTGIFRLRENVLAFVTGGTSRWFINESGHLLPEASTTYDVGDSTNLVRNIAAGGTLHVLGSLAHVTAQVQLGDGAATAPALAFLQYPNTGIYRSASPGLSVSVGGSQTWEFASGGDFLPATHAGSAIGSATQMAESIFSVDYFFAVRSSAFGNPATKQVRLYIRDDVNQDGAATNDCVLRARLQSGAEIHVATLVLDGSCP